jgi:esterase
MKLSFRKLGSGKPLFILHGLFGSSDNWQTLGKQFAGSFTVFLIDLRNHGRSPHSSLFNYSVMSDDIAELMQDEGIERTALLGHSMGGKTAMHFAVQHSGMAERIIVADIGTKEYPATNQHVIDAVEQVNLAEITSRQQASEKLKTLLADEGTIQFLLKNLYWTEAGKLDWRFNLEAISQNIHFIGEATPVPAAPLTLPALFLAGGNSSYIVRGDMEEIQLIFPHSSLEVIPEAGHWIHAEQPALFFDAVMRFMKREQGG